VNLPTVCGAGILQICYIKRKIHQFIVFKECKLCRAVFFLDLCLGDADVAFSLGYYCDMFFFNVFLDLLQASVRTLV
jgi:hypothetical protein